MVRFSPFRMRALFPSALLLCAFVLPGCAGKRAPAPPPSPIPPPAEVKPVLMYVGASSLNVRRGPSAGEPRLGTLPRAARVEVVDTGGGGWLRVRAEAQDLEGWVSGEYLVPDDPWGPAAPGAGDIPISAALGFNEFQFNLRNMDDFPWRDVVIYVNPDSPDRGYRYEAGEFAPRSERNVGAWRFRNLDGEKLDPAAVPFDEIRITCRTPAGRGYWVGHP